MDFSKWLNNEFIPNNKEYKWIKEVSSKSVRQSIMNAERAYTNFFKGKSKFPNFKKKNKSDVKMYFVRTDAKTIIPCERHRIKIPTLGWVQLKEKGYIPTNPQTHIIKSGTVSYKAGRYYVSVLVEQEAQQALECNNYGIGVDLGVKDFAICSNGKTYKNINKSSHIKKLEKKLKKEGELVDGIYNQDISGNSVLIEVGGVDNNIDEARVYLSKLLKKDGCMFYINNFYVAIDKSNNHIVGLICAIDKSSILTYDYKEDMKINDRYKFTIEKYVKPIEDYVRELENENHMYISNVCVTDED